MTNKLRRLFPGLLKGEWAETSPYSTRYNCMSWSVGDKDKVWNHLPGNAWPTGVGRAPDLGSYITAYESMGYTRGADDSWVPEVEKVALYSDANGLWTHVARQCASGSWTSKLGKLQDIRHDHLRGVENNAYGTVAEIMQRRKAPDRDSDEREDDAEGGGE